MARGARTAETPTRRSASSSRAGTSRSGGSRSGGSRSGGSRSGAPRAGSASRSGASRTGAGSRSSASRRRSATPDGSPARGRVGRDRLYLLGIVAVVVLLGVLAVGPYADYTASQDRLGELTAQRDQLTGAVEELESEAARLEDPATLEEAAREDLGMVRPGEIPFIVVNPPTEPPAPISAGGPVPADEAESPASAVGRVVDRVVGAVRDLLP